MRCLYCDEVIVPVVSWSTLFSREVKKVLCERCEGALVRTEGDCCVRCSRPLGELSEEFRRGELCYDCVRWEEDQEWRGVLERNVSLYVYNDLLKEVIGRYKFRGDYVLAKIFSYEVGKLVKTLTADLLVPIPLSEERLYERGFNQAEAIIVESGLSPSLVLKRTHTEKQSKKTREDRIRLKDVFQFTGEVDVVNRRVLLVDDIYTTGSTLMHGAKLLKQNGALSVSSITIARG